MLLIFKTNDLLRGIEHKLGTQRRMASFLTMSRCCVRAVAAHEIKHCPTEWCKLRVRLWYHWEMFKLDVYSCYLVLNHWLGVLLGRRSNGDGAVDFKLFRQFA
jgi:aarF domain-containing kinase